MQVLSFKLAKQDFGKYVRNGEERKSHMIYIFK